MTPLGRLQAIDVREVWSSEAEQFTPWLAKEENIRLLGEADMQVPLEWEELPGKKESHAFLRRNDTDAADRAKWPEQHQWLAETLEAFHRTMSGRVKYLDATTTDETSPVASCDP